MSTTIKKCPKCQKEVDAKATKCPHCQSDLRSWIRQHPIGLLILVLIFVPIMMQVVAPSPEISQEEQTANMMKSSAESFARSYVKSTLKAPSTAKFNNFASVKADPNDPNLITVISSVDSENSYGAMLNSSWSLTLRYTGDSTKEAIDNGENYKIVEFTFDGKKIK